MRQTFILLFFFSLTMAMFGSDPASVYGQEAPIVTAISNAPGWVTVYWKHSGKDVSGFYVQRQEPAFTWGYEVSNGSHTDMGLQANTTYNYRVCAVDADSEETCSSWLSVKTMPPESPNTPLAVPTFTRQEAGTNFIRLSWSSTTKYGSFNVRWSEKGAPAVQVNVEGSVTYGSYEARNLQPGRAYVFGVQGCNWGFLGSSCSGWRAIEVNTLLPPPPPPTAPSLTASASSERNIVLTWPINEAERITRTVVERDGSPYDQRAAAFDRLEDTVRPNTEYTYRVCLTNQTGTACSDTVTAMPKPVAPSAPASVAFTQSRFSGGPASGGLREQARIKSIVTATWRNSGTPGQFITLEREDRVPLDQISVGVAWVEIKRINAKTDPTEIWADKPSGTELGGSQGNTYRICAVVPALGDQGKVCSSRRMLP